MQKNLEELLVARKTTLSVGSYMHSSYWLLPEVCREFYKKHKTVKVTLDMGNDQNTGLLYEKLKNNKIDLFLTNYKYSDLIMIPIVDERYIIAMHKSMSCPKKLEYYALSYSQIVTKNYDKNLETEDRSLFDDIEFIRFGKSTLINIELTNMLGNYKRSPYVVENSHTSEIQYKLMCAGIGAILTTDIIIKNNNQSADDLLFFVPKTINSYRTIYLAKTHNTDNNSVVESFIKTAKKIANK